MSNVFKTAILLLLAAAAASLAAGVESTNGAQKLTGAALLRNLERLPDLRPFAHSYQVSSHDKTGLGFDVGHIEDDGLESYLYEEDGRYVLFDQEGPGTVTRIWFTWTPPASAFGDIRLQFYFDGEAKPRVDHALRDLLSGTQAPFLFPLAAGEDSSSGGYISYVPMPFSESLKISTTGFPLYYAIGYEKYSNAISVDSFSPQDDLSDVLATFSRAGSDPKSREGPLVHAGSGTIQPGDDFTLFQQNGPGIIGSIRIRAPQIVPAPVHNELLDEGRHVSLQSRFIVAIDPANEGVVLRRRLDYGLPDQSSFVLVDGVVVGSWTNPGSDEQDRWRDSSFTIPASHTTGKAALEVRVVDTGGEQPWTEYRYWVNSLIGGQSFQTDTFDVGNVESEAAHGYLAPLGALVALRDTYPPLQGDPNTQGASREVLTGARIQAYWDGDSTPSVDAPLGAFFGSWAGETPTKALMMGMETDGFYYMFFPMPYATAATIKLVNESSVLLEDVTFEVSYDPTPYPGLGTTAGYFHATAREETPTVSGHDYVLLETEGQGHVVGTVLFMRSLPDAPFSFPRGHLEGDERIYLDGSAACSLWNGDRGFLQCWVVQEAGGVLPADPWVPASLLARGRGRRSR